MTKTKALLEIGVEHLPARFVKPALNQMQELAVIFLRESNIGFESVKAFGSYRKLCLSIEGLQAKAEDISKEVKGPPAKILKDDKGKFTVQAEGFAKKNGLKPTQLIVKDFNGKGDFIFAITKVKGERANNILAKIFPEIIKTINFPKNMIWQEQNFKFARPIRNILALNEDKVIKFTIGGIKSGRESLPMVSFSSKAIKIKDANSYILKLKNLTQPIIIDDKERETILIKALEHQTKKLGCKLFEDEETKKLLQETVYLTEHPVLVAGKFDERFLKLPQPLLKLVMMGQIKIFPLQDLKTKKLSNHFIAVRDGVSENQKEVMQGFTNVLSARLEDAVFFYEKDLKLGLDHFKAKLKDIQYLGGTMEDKRQRVQNIALGYDLGDSKKISEACKYLYSDLASNVVFEFPELQGYMASIYSKNKLVNVYKKPTTLEGSLIYIAHRMDNLASNFSVGNIPTGSEDPYALRRDATEIVKVLCDNKITFTIGFLAEYPNIENFFYQRVEYLFIEKGFKPDEISAVYKPNINLDLMNQILKALHKARKDKNFKDIAEPVKRVCNILKKHNKENLPKVNEKLLKEKEEKELYEKIKSVDKKSLNKEPHKTFKLFASFKDKLENFFNKIMVNVENEEIKLNRLSLLREVETILTETIADLSELN
ncbi:MAG: glycine--tRNA ligase subunit beta [Elusimicrobiaceae bacterium]|jgi:glycyl-tRNA synthetase beta chain|nr:glycine--tRNA ligase subunit beta [Elusimicrobiaceae bacterium]MBT3955376.1 glycine--tRNA ligase subunit beta [Elusimicrobiaceae bacterium]MBT4007653.1 glycine--tRNA ligase subunit beta [Elusimicrobiaceae bacterium]MBT4403184.1 glycine--tRNA ligase subunit beta [Elusimicrobiaceae bacterium]MBT4439570.1 glycine--tRNA ligase subunit beta [Elusimicrobiaceae bacterium]